MNDTNTQTSSPSGLRKFLWPVYGIEHKKFLPMTLMISMILFNYTLVRNMKDTLVVSSTGGSEVITALKLYGVLPSAFIFFFIIMKLYNVFSRENVFYILVSFFVGFFALFALYLYPNQEAIQPVASSAWLRETLPEGKFFEVLIGMYQYWHFALFYICSELWGSVVASLLFWQFANSIVRVSEAKRFYGHFYLLANLATAASGYCTRFYSTLGKNSGLATEFERFGVTVNYTVYSVVIIGILIMVLFRWMDKKIVTDSRLVSPDDVAPSKKKLKMSMGQSVKFIFSSKYLGLIALLVVCYGISINLVEVAWKHEIRELYPDKNDYNSYMGLVTMLNGMATFVVILLGSYLVRLMGWRAGALATPIILGATGLLFFYFMIFDSSATPLAAMLGTTVVFMSVLFGTIQNVMSKSTKYALFDPTKEMAYIPLDAESKAKGKAAVDVVGGRLGKAGGSGLQQILFLVTGLGTTGIAPYSAAIVLGIVVIWILAVIALSKRFNALGGEEISR